MKELATPRGTLRIRANTDGVYFARVHRDDGEVEDLIPEANVIVERLARVNHPAVSGLQVVGSDETMLDVVHPFRGPATPVSALETTGAILRAVADIVDGLAAIASLDDTPIPLGPLSPRLFLADPMGGRLLCPGLWGAAYDFDKRLRGTHVVPLVEMVSFHCASSRARGRSVSRCPMTTSTGAAASSSLTTMSKSKRRGAMATKPLSCCFA